MTTVPLTAEPLTIAPPEIGVPSLGQIHGLRAEPLETKLPEIVESRGVHHLHIASLRRTRKSRAYLVELSEPYCGSVCGRNASHLEKNCRTANI
jgi:hypothetical protein